MMNVVIEDKKRVRTLKVGDILITRNGVHVCIVVEDRLTTRSDCRYGVKIISAVNDNILFSCETLEELTRQAIDYEYSIYSQDEYELVIRRKA